MTDVSLGLAHEVEVLLRKVGATRENFWVPLSKDEGLARRVLELVNVLPTYDIIVDYSRSLAKMIEAGNYDWVNDDVTEEHFSMEGEGRKEMEVALFHFGRYMQSEEIITEMDKQGYRPAVIEELLALGEAEPELQREFPIVVLGSVWRGPDVYRYVPSLFGNGSGRVLRLFWFVSGWGPGCRFAALRK